MWNMSTIFLFLVIFSPTIVLPNRSSKQLYYSQLLFPNLYNQGLSTNLQSQSHSSVVSSGSTPYYTTLWSSNNANNPTAKVVSPASTFYQVPFQQQPIGGSQYVLSPQYLQHFQQYPSFGNHLVPIQHQQQQFQQQQQQQHQHILPGHQNSPNLEFKHGDEDTEVIDILDSKEVTKPNPYPQQHQQQQQHHQKQKPVGFDQKQINQIITDDSLSINNIYQNHKKQQNDGSYKKQVSNQWFENEESNAISFDQSSTVNNKGPKVICYFANWAYYRGAGEGGQYLPENVDPFLCTHLIYAFATYEVRTGHLKPTDSDVDDGEQFFVRIANLKKMNPNLKILLAVGGWTDSGDNKYSVLANSIIKRRTFAQEALGFVKYYDFDGISIDWHYPVCWQSDCAKGPKSDRNGFTELLRELRDVFQPQGFLVAASLSGYKEVIDIAYDVPKLSEYLDFMNIMTYDYHGSWESRTGHLSPLFEGSPSEDLKPTYNSNYTMEYYVSRGAERSKLILGIPFYGQTFTLESQYDSSLGSLAEGPGNPGESTQQAGMLAYYEICRRVKNEGWTMRRDKGGSWGPYAYKENQWVGYDDPDFVKRKARYIKNNNYGGAFAFTLDLDDFNNVCCGGSHPLLRTIANELLNVPLKPAKCGPPSNVPAPAAPATQRPTTVSTMVPPPASPGCYYQTRPHDTDCNAYYRCINDMEIIQRCPSGLHWNRHALTCDWPANSGCMDSNVTPKPADGRPTRPTTQVVEQSSTQPPQMTTQPSTTQNTDDCVNGQYYEASNCEQYYLCSDGRKQIQNCGPGLHWSSKNKLCDRPNEAKCQRRSESESDTKFEIDSSCQDGDHSGSTRDCSVYYVCVHGEKMKFRCQGGLHWNDQLKICDWPANAGCTASGSPPEYPVPTTTSSTTYRPVSSTQDSFVPTFPSNQGSSSTSTAFPVVTMPTTYSTTSMPTTRPSTSTTFRPAPTQPAEVPSGTTDLSGDYMIVCYFTNWAWYRPGNGKYTPDNINRDLCTHIVYGFAVLDTETLTIKPHDSWADIDNRFYEKVAELRNRGKTVTMAIGGWNDSAGDKYSRLVNNPVARRRFVKHVVEFIEKYNFQGLDLDWEYPKCWQVECDKGPASDKPAFAALVQELSEAFKPRGLLLSSAVSPSKTVIDAGYDVPTLSRYFDWISVMTYDFHGQWDKKTGHVAPLYFHEEDDVFFFNANYSINYWIEKGADRRKIVMGMPLYGQSFTLTNAQENGLNAPSTGGGTAGEFTRASGFLAYYEICTNIQRNGWQVVYDSSGAIGPYAYKGNQWVSFDDVAIIKKKSEYIRQMDLGGGMVWALDLDDFRNVCGQGASPLLSTIRNVLGPARSRYGVVKPPSTNKLQVGNNQLPIDEKPKKQVVSSKPAIIGGGSKIKTEDLEGASCTDQFKPHDKDCSKYYQCQFGKYIEQQCPPGTVWNNDRCDWPGNSDCKLGAAPPPPRPKPTTSATSTTEGSYVPAEELTTTTTIRTTTTRRPPQRPPARPTNAPENYPQYPDLTTSIRPSKTTATPTKDPAWCKQNWCPTPKPIPPNKHVEIQVPPSPYKVVCYFTNWAWYRPGAGKYMPHDIDFNLCTHIAYGFAVLNPSTLLIRPHDGWADLENQFYKQVSQLRYKGIKVVLALGGWNDSLGDKYSRLVHDPEARRRFVEHAVEFIEEHDFDGLDLDWEYPKCWQVDCEKGPDTDKERFIDLVRELSAAFKPRGLLLSSAVSPNNKVIDLGYDVPAVNKYLDWIAVMTYDFFGQWDGKTGHNSPLYEHPEIENKYFNTNFSINYWIEQGADRRKIVMGMPMYGQSFTLVNASNTGLNSKSSGGSQAGEFTRQKGFLAYYEICNYVQNRGWTVVQDDEHRIGPYAYKGNQWVSFDDIDQIRRKSEYIKRMGLGGGMIWALDLDDFRGNCGCEEHPLLKTINRVLRKYPEPDPGCRF